MKTLARSQRMIGFKSWVNAWDGSNSSFMRRGVLSLEQDCGFAREMSFRGLKLFFEQLKRDAAGCGTKLRALGWEPESRWTIVAPGNVPTPLLAVCAAGILSGARVWIKPSSSHKRFAAVVAESLKRGSAAIQIDTDRAKAAGRVEAGDHAIVYGADRVVRELKDLGGKNAVFVPRGERGSVALIDDRKRSPEQVRKWAARTALDIWLYDQRGCLSPRAVWVRQDPDRFARALYTELTALNTRFGGSVKRPAKWREEREAALTQIGVRTIRRKGFKLYGNPQDPRDPVVFLAPDSGFSDIKVTGQAVGVFKTGDFVGELSRINFSLAGVSATGDMTPIRQWLRRSPEVWLTRPGRLQCPPTFWNLLPHR